MMANRTQVHTSPTKFNTYREKHVKRSNLKLSDLPDQTDGTRISSTVKVVGVEEKVLVSGDQSLQSVVILDSTVANKIVLWNNDIGKLKARCSYQVIVKSYQDEKFLQFPKQGATMEEVEDIVTVSSDNVNKYEQIDQSEVTASTLTWWLSSMSIMQECGSTNVRFTWNLHKLWCVPESKSL